jgi:hypothetical protein
MSVTVVSEPESVLRNWRIRILNGVLLVVAAVSVPAYVVMLSNAVSRADLRPFALVFSIIEVLLLAVVVFRRINFRIRVFGLLLFGYAATIVNLGISGLRGAGPLYLLVIPILALILMGRRAGILATAFSLLIAALAAMMFELGC